ncbi:MAG: CHAT domain-containing protein [Chitinophagaceae bacterium]|nr:CHAT domain-containing protein [Chitinophagaceae bacterium]
MFFILWAVLLTGIPAFPQNANLQNNVAGPQYTELKYSISFADQSQMVHDGIKLKTQINQSFMETGDVAYYNGKYFNAAARYLYAASSFPQTTNSGYGLYKILAGGADPSKMDDKMKKIYTSAASTVGMLYQTRGKFTAAETLLKLAMDIRERSFGKTSREYINSLHNMAVLKKDLGQYEEAERMFNYLVPAFKKLFTVNSLQYVVVINNRAMLLAELGRTKEAIALLDEALKLGEAVLSASYIDYERILTNRALLEQESGNSDKAETYYQQALAGMEKKEMEDHPDYNNVLVYYGSLRVEKNDADVTSFLSGVAGKVKKRYGDDHPLYAKALINSGDHYLNKKMYADAKAVYNDAAGIQLKKLGEKHKDYLGTMLKIAVCEWQLQDNSNASARFQKTIRQYIFLAENLFRTMSESEKTNFWRTLKPALDTYFSFILDAGKDDPELLREGYNFWIATKGMLINSTKQTKNIILNSSDPATRKLYEDWLNLKTTLAAYYSSPLEDLKEDKIDLDEIEKQANTIEKELTKRSSRFSEEYLRKPLRLPDVKDLLLPGEAAIEIIRSFHYYGDKKGQAEYAALVVKKGIMQPVLVHIGNGADLEKYASAYKRYIRNKIADPKAYSLYWQPLEQAIGDSKKIYLSVDGVYNSINPNTFQKNDGTYLLDAYEIILLPNTASIASAKTQLPVVAGKSEATLMGSPFFGNDALIPPLPGTKEEVQRIDTLLLGSNVSTKLYTDQNASEENIKLVKGPAVLHVATHGFFNPDVSMDKAMTMGVQVSKAKNNALLRSGLLLNGAASVYNDEPNLLGSNNGVLYAFEAMNLDLRNTKLVVLSACETGTGEIINGEGVYGLCRSFQVAGASKILMSLWKVDDAATKDLMTAFYNNWTKLNDPQQAFVQAQKTIKEKYPQPYYWGAFVLLN